MSSEEVTGQETVCAKERTSEESTAGRGDCRAGRAIRNVRDSWKGQGQLPCATRGYRLGEAEAQGSWESMAFQ